MSAPRRGVSSLRSSFRVIGWRAAAAAWLTMAALVCGVWGAWIPAKAALAQVLIGRSFDAALRTGTPPPPPWPWADTVPVARLSVPRLGIERLVLAGASGAPLAFGPGHLTGTPSPAERGNAVIAGHRDTHFAFLKALRTGDEIIAQTAGGERVTYGVTWARVVPADATWVAEPTVERALTLVTCFPFGGLAGRARERFVVRAVAASRPPVDAPASILW